VIETPMCPPPKDAAGAASMTIAMNKMRTQPIDRAIDILFLLKNCIY
jgi:hypothetical protein